MGEANTQSALRCKECNKLFEKQSTLKRHGYYCRSRKTSIGITRARACVSCVRGKVRCDNTRPRCSRCINKNIECHYPANSSRGTGPKIPHNDDARAVRRRMTPSLPANSTSVENRQEASSDGGIIPDSSLMMPDLEFAVPGEIYPRGEELEIDFGDFLDSQMPEETAQYSSSGPSSLVRYSMSSTGQPVPGPQTISLLNIPIPPIPTYPRSLIHRPKMNPGPQRVANLILRTLKSYPRMMLRHNTLPPFIHPRSVSSNAGKDHMEPVANCVNLVRMISNGVQGSRKLFWRNVRLECEHLCEEQPNLNKWELLAAMQSLAIYILIRLDEGETDHNDFDFLLLATVTIMAKHFPNGDMDFITQPTSYDYGLDASWEDWVFEESRRRLCLVYRVLNMLVYFDPAAMCSDPMGLILAPLPAKKQLWEAADAFSWKTELERDHGVQTTYGLATDGELVKLDEGQVYCRDKVLMYRPFDATAPAMRTVDWEEWCTGMDGFGGLVMLVASLVV